MWARVFPFLAYLAFLALAQAISWFAGRIPTGESWDEQAILWLYPIKTVTVLGLLIYFWPQYEELRVPVFRGWSELVLAIAVGLVVYALWVRMDWSWAMQASHPVGYNPFAAGTMVGSLLAAFRLLGACIVVPTMEELFWRSFLLRYLMSANFERIPLGTMTPFSLAVTIILFGFEHDLWLAGMMAGMVYTLLLYYTGRLWPCVLSHGTTNLALGIHVLVTREWRWW